jgi:DNA-binding transcriptional LysR family regulator
MQMNISTKEAEYILAIIQEGNLTKAAQKLYIAQPSLTQTVQKMEQQFGVKLFIREGHRMEPTYAGKRFVEMCSKIVKICRDVENEFEEISMRNHDRVIAGMPFNLASYIFPLLYTVFQKKYPDTKVIPIEGTSINLEKMLISGTVDIAIIPLPYKNSSLEFQKIFEGKLVLSIPQNHWLNQHAQQKPGEHFPVIDIKLADREPFIMSLPGQRVRLATEKLFKQAGITPKIVFITKNIETKKRMSATGLGLTIFPEHYLEFYSTPAGANYYYISSQYDSAWTVGAIFRKDTYITNSASQCLSILTNLFKNYHPYLLNSDVFI